MAIIEIRGRREKLTIDNARALKIKTLRFGDINGNGMADSKDGIEIGEWTGELGKIISIEIEKPRVYKQEEVWQEPTPEEKEKLGKIRKDTREWLEEKGIINKK